MSDEQIDIFAPESRHVEPARERVILDPGGEPSKAFGVVSRNEASNNFAAERPRAFASTRALGDEIDM